MTPCPNDDDLLRFVDGALAVEAMDRIRGHFAGCARCRHRDQSLRQLVADLGAPVPATLDVPAHVRAVMDRLDRPLAPRSAGRPGRWAFAGGFALAACLLVAFYARVQPPGRWQARGGAALPSLDRDVGVRAYAVRGAPQELAAGDAIDRDTPLTAGFRNAGDRPAFLLLFAVDARRVVHWIAPPYLRPGDDPSSATLSPTPETHLLATTAVLDDVPAGPLRIVSVVTLAPAHVSDVEALEGSEVGAAQLQERLPGAQVCETRVEVRP
jgi:hypothetical protein